MEWITWVEEDGTQLIRNGRGVLDHRKACRSGRAVVIIHWNLEVSALQVRVRGINSEVPATAPGNLQAIQED